MKKPIEIALANILVLGLVLAVFASLGRVQSLYPLNGMVTYDRTPSFQWSGWGSNYELLIDDSPDFAMPVRYHVKGTSFSIPDDLDFGTYWWKVLGNGIESESKQFTVESLVALSRPDKDVILNTGNTELLVHSGSMAGAVVLGVNSTLEVGGDDNVVAEQK